MGSDGEALFGRLGLGYCYSTERIVQKSLDRVAWSR